MDTYEKKYKDAQKWIESIYTELSHEHQMEAEAFFPELKESEDEKVRKSIIKFLIDVNNGAYTKSELEIASWIAWLEKQGEPKETICDKCRKEQPSHSCQDITANGRCYIEGMNTSNKVEPKFKVKYAGNEYNVLEVKDIAGVTFYGIEDEPNHIDYVKADNCEIINGGYGIKENGCSFPTKPIMFSEQNHAWSVEDMSKVQRICMYLDEAKKYYADITEVRECIDWLKSLKDRVQPKQEWSEEDEEFLRRAINVAKDKYPMTANWLKSLKQRIGWKPSEEQIECLYDAINHYQTNGYPASKLNELYEQMSKIYKL